MSSRQLIQRIRSNIGYERKSSSKKWRWFPVWQPATPNEKLVPALASDVVVPKKGPRLYQKYGFKLDDQRVVYASKVTKLIKYERVEFPYHQAIEIRACTERLICEAIRHGPNHNPTMELASFWLQEPNLVHKLFKVLVPRYLDYTTSFTSLYKLPPLYEGSTLGSSEVTLTMKQESIQKPFFDKTTFSVYQGDRGVLELKGKSLEEKMNDVSV